MLVRHRLLAFLEQNLVRKHWRPAGNYGFSGFSDPPARAGLPTYISGDELTRPLRQAQQAAAAALPQPAADVLALIRNIPTDWQPLLFRRVPPTDPYLTFLRRTFHGIRAPISDASLRAM
jgi:hypothetical protein